MPTALMLPKQCRLSVKVRDLEAGSSPVWATVRDHIVVFSITDIGESLRTIEALPANLFGSPPIAKVRLHF